MSWRLVTLEGPHAGNVYTLNSGEVLVGRDEASDVRLDDLQVSRRHCTIRVGERGLTIEDLGSRNGIYVNDVPVRHDGLAHGDRVRVGSTVLLVVSEEGGAGAPRVELVSGAGAPPTMALPPAAPPPRGRGYAAGATIASDGSLLPGLAALAGAQDAETAHRLLLELLLDVVPADRGAILTDDAAEPEPVAVLSRERGARRDETFRIDAGVVRSVFDESASVLRAAPSDAGASLLALPLAANGRTLGAIYLEASGPGARLDETHARAAESLAVVGALALLNAETVEWHEGERRRLNSGVFIDHQMVGESAAMQSLYLAIQRIAHTDATVLIRGESGTGKELVARAIHRNGPRATKPFVAINCATLTETLLESELFGYEKGAFTGAAGQKRGKLEVADGGTVFLDEIGEMPPALQAKLLRAIQERQFERVGGTQPVKVDVRWIAATNLDLEAAIAGGRFRRDLFYRLNVISLSIPPLRSRKEDIPLLASYFAARYAEKFNRRISGLSREARASLLRYSWPGNVRELQNAIERAVVLGSSDQILVEDLPDTVLGPAPGAPCGESGFQQAVADFKRGLVRDALERESGDLARAARRLGLHPRYIYRLLKSLDIDVREDLRRGEEHTPPS